MNPTSTLASPTADVLIGVVACVIAGAWTLRRLPARLAGWFCVLTAVAMIPLNLLHPTVPSGIVSYAEPRLLFHVLKGTTVALCAAFVLYAPTLARRVPWWRVVAVGALALNIVEALAAELRKGLTINLATGVLLIAMLPVASRVSIVRGRSRERISFPVDWPFIAIYAMWNFAFVLQITGQGRWIAFNAVQLIAPLVWIRSRPDRFFEARVLTLFVAVLLWQLHGVYDPLLASADVWSERTLMHPIRNVGFIAALVYVVASHRNSTRAGAVRTLLDGILRRRGARREHPRGPKPA